jgi:hypothetical protein
MEPMELNLDNPIFVVYLNIDGHTRQKAQELIEQYRRFLNYDNATFWIMAVEDQKTKIELLWKGQKYEIPSNDNSVKTIKKRLTKLVDIISEGLTDDVIKQKLRDYLLNDILDDKI